MDRQALAASGGVVVWVDFRARVASYEPPPPCPRIDWMSLASDAEAKALTAKTRAERESLIRCALALRAKARSVV